MRIGSTFLTVAAFLGLAACGGGGGDGGNGGGGPPSTTLSVTNMTPANGATGVSRKNSVVLTFSTTLDIATLSSTTVSLTTATGVQAIITSVAGNTMTVTPLIALAPLIPYRVTIGVGLRGARGEALTGPITASFTTADRQWQTATRLEPVGPTTAEEPKVVADKRGNVIAVWQRRDGQTRSIWSNRYTAGAGWATPVQISTMTNATSSANNPEIDLDVSGNAAVVWDQLDNGVFSIWSNRYIIGTGWGTAVQIQTRTNTTGNALGAHIAFDGLGNALAVWAQAESGVLGIWSNRYTAGGNWGTAVPVEQNSGDADSPQVAFDFTSGKAFAIWNQGDGACKCIWSNQYTPGNGWGTPKMIASGTAQSAFLPQIAVDGFGNAYAVWTQSDDGQQFDIWANRFAAGGAWGSAVIIDDHTGGAGTPKIVADLNGNAYVVWEQTQPTALGLSIRWNRYMAGTGWGTAGLIAPATDPTGTTGGNPQIAFDPNGIAHAVWEHDDGTRTHVRSSRLMPASGWAQPLDTGSTDSAAEPAIAADPSGDLTAVWEQLDGAGVSVWSNRFE
jgi:hypothetical protein